MYKRMHVFLSNDFCQLFQYMEKKFNIVIRGYSLHCEHSFDV